ncbi:hypothetical protein RB597_003553 [Gaeumannomyces tritici]
MESLHIDTRLASVDGPQSPRAPPKEVPYQGDYGSNRNGGTPRTPRRSQTVYDYQPAGLPDGWIMMQNGYTPQVRESQAAAGRIPSPIAEAPPAVEGGDSDSMSVTSSSSSDKNYQVAPAPEANARPRRPALPPPRRSYSVMDYEPVPYTHRPSAVLALMDLPGEVHYNIFDHLDSIDGTCLGLTNKHFYAIHRRMHGTVALTQRRAGPNDMEWAWHLAGNVKHHANSPVPRPPADPAAVAAVAAVAAAGGEAEKKALEKKALAMLRVRGHAYCRKCGISRCELHTHIKDWMGDSYEYCNVRQKYGPKAPEGVKSFCYLSNPKKPGRCGRHRVTRPQSTPTQTDIMSPVTPGA